MKRSILLAIAVASLVKLSFALFTIGTSDVATWRSFADSVQACGSCVYQSVGPYGDRFNHPPFIIYFLKLIAGADRLFPFWLRLPSILADIGSVLLIRKMLPKVSVSLLILLSLNPVSILVSGFHGNTDPLMIFFVVLTLYLFSIERVGWAGAAFGMAINIKIVPLLVVPAVFFYLRGWKARTIFCSVAVFVVLVLSAPYVFNSPLAIIKGTLGYSGRPRYRELNFPFDNRCGDASRVLLDEQTRSASVLPDRLYFISVFLFDTFAWRSVPGMDGAVRFGIRSAMVYSLLRKRWTSPVPDLQLLVTRPMVFC